MKKGLTELVFIVDRNGPMSGLEGDIIGGKHERELGPSGRR